MLFFFSCSFFFPSQLTSLSTCLLFYFWVFLCFLVVFYIFIFNFLVYCFVYRCLLLYYEAVGVGASSEPWELIILCLGYLPHIVSPWVVYLPHIVSPGSVLLAPYCFPWVCVTCPIFFSPGSFPSVLVQSSQNSTISPHTFLADLGQPSDYGVKQTSLF